MHILITGGTGFIGQAFINTYSDIYQFTVLTRDTATAHQVFHNITPEHIRYINNLEELDTPDDQASIDAIINLAGEPIMNKLWSAKQKHKLEASRWETTQQLADFIIAGKLSPKVFISGSAIGCYGRQGDKVINETQAVSYPEYSTELCQHWEQIAQSVASLTRVVISRTGIVLGKDKGALAKMQTPFKLGLGGRIGDGCQFMSWIHINDMVTALNFLLLHKTLNGPFNLTAPNPVTNRQFSRQLAAVFGKKARFTTPATLLRLLLGERADLIIYGQRVLPNRLIEAGFEFSHPNLTDALTEIYIAKSTAA